MKRFLVLAQTVVLKLATIGSIGNINGLSARDEGRRGGALASSFDQSLPRPTQGRAPEWRLGTVSRVDGAASQLVLTDGSLVRVTPATNIHRHEQRLT
ncbi:MAG: hypothetical protein HY216_03995, partial [Candidatus Rokubacteria bacterium]|nr:hypothetical protein [Candidatus Rokubacteria bacterium]